MSENSRLIPEKLNYVASKWENQFKNRPKLEFHFSVTETGMLCLNNIPLSCTAEQVDPDSIEHDVEMIGFATKDGIDFFEISISWPFGEDPKLEGITKHSAIYDAKAS